jgi:hypothetical protein
MYIPFVFNIDYEELKTPKYMWIFYKFIDFCSKYDFPIIAQEKYFESPDTYNHAVDFMTVDYEFSIPTKEQLIKKNKYQISEEETNQIIDIYTDKEKCWLDLLKNENKILEKLIEEKLKLIQNDFSNANIKAILTWVYLPSLKKVCDRMNIPLIQLELSAIRKENYNLTLGYFTFDNKYSLKKIKEEFPEYQKISNDIPKYDRQTLLTMFLKTENIDYLKLYYNPPEYKFGLDLGMPNECFFNTYSKYTHSEINKQLSLLTNNEEILARGHPQAIQHQKEKNNFQIDNSKNSIEWILKCRRIVSSVSNVAFEAMLLGKTSYVLSENMPFYYNAITDLNAIEDEVVGLSYLNYLIFCYFVPYQLMFNKDYLDFRLKNPNIKAIYLKNSNYILKNINWKSDKVINQKWILENFHKLSKEKIIEIMNYNTNTKLKQIEKELESVIETNKNLELITNKEKELLKNKNLELVMLNEQLGKELEKIINSKSWKITKPLRNMALKISKMKKVKDCDTNEKK